MYQIVALFTSADIRRDLGDKKKREMLVDLLSKLCPTETNGTTMKTQDGRECCKTQPVSLGRNSGLTGKDNSTKIQFEYKESVTKPGFNVNIALRKYSFTVKIALRKSRFNVKMALRKLLFQCKNSVTKVQFQCKDSITKIQFYRKGIVTKIELDGQGIRKKFGFYLRGNTKTFFEWRDLLLLLL